jgi:HAD superfamily hydrolase (TIGR01458 family)
MIAGILLDLSGVIYVGSKPLPGALDAMARLRDMALPIRFLTNTTRTPKQRILQNLRDMGLPCDEDELFTPARAAGDWLTLHKRSPHLLIHPDLAEDFDDLPSHDRTAVVIGDAGEAFTYQTLNAAFRQLTTGSELIALAGNRTFLDKDGKLSLDAGAFVAALEYGTQMTAKVLGKPSPDFFQAALSSMGCVAQNAVMIGDDAEADVSGAILAGIGVGLLVKTGKYTAGAEGKVDPPPSDTVDDFEAAVDWIMEHCSTT